MKSKFLILLGVISFIGCNQNKPNTPKITEKFELTIDQPTDSILKKELEQIAVEDQTLRLMLPDVEEKFGKGSSEVKYIWSLIHRQDSICLIKTLKILDKYGWLGKSRVGDNANQALWLVIQHAELSMQETYLPLLKKSVEMGESEGWHQAFLEDRILMRNKKNQLYGSQATWDKTIGKMKIYPIDDVRNVNKRREQIGLEPIEEYAKMNGYIFDPKN
jgi:hypothetical protein